MVWCRRVCGEKWRLDDAHDAGLGVVPKGPQRDMEA